MHRILLQMCKGFDPGKRTAGKVLSTVVPSVTGRVMSLSGKVKLNRCEDLV